jgi:hypothetical protein
MKGRGSIEGSTLTFSLYKGKDVAEQLVHTFQSPLEAYGAVAVVQQSYTDEADYIGAAKAAFAKLLDGSWKPGRMPGEEKPPLIVQAIATVQKIPVEQALSVYKGLDNQTKKNLRKVPAVAKELASLEAAAAKAKAATAKATPSAVDVGALFGTGEAAQAA